MLESTKILHTPLLRFFYGYEEKVITKLFQ